MNEVLPNFYLHRLRWIKFGTGDVHQNLIRNCEFCEYQHNVKHKMDINEFMPVLFSFTDLADIKYRDLHTLL
jgi:hypothetical protein